MTPRPATLLVVDDTPDNITVMSEVLAPLGLRVKVATSGERALTVARKDPPDLVLLDVLMPGMDGFETCRRLKADPLTAHVPVVFVTAKTDELDQGRAAGGVDWITKPVDALRVRECVTHHLAQRPGAPAEPSAGAA